MPPIPIIPRKRTMKEILEEAERLSAETYTIPVDIFDSIKRNLILSPGSKQVICHGCTDHCLCESCVNETLLHADGNLKDLGALLGHLYQVVRSMQQLAAAQALEKNRQTLVPLCSSTRASAFRRWMDYAWWQCLEAASWRLAEP